MTSRSLDGTCQCRFRRWIDFHGSQEAIAIRFEAIALRLEAWAIAIRFEAIALRLEAMAMRF